MEYLWQTESPGIGSPYVDLFKSTSSDYRDWHVTREPAKGLENTLKHHQKNNPMSLKARQTGNEKFNDGNWTEAMNFYNKSLCYAEIGSENVCFAYANRSTCFFHLQRYEQCLIDIELAKQANYPKRLVFKLEERRQSCWEHMESSNRLEETLIQELSYTELKNYPGMANVLQFQQNTKFGRHITAKCDIDVGRIVLVEEAFVAQQRDKNTFSCKTCLRKLSNFIACNDCATAMFCNINCMKKNLDHKIDCTDAGDEFTTKECDTLTQSIYVAANLFSDTQVLINFVEDVIKNSPNDIPLTLNSTKSRYRAFLKLNVHLTSDKKSKLLSEVQRKFQQLLLRNSVKKRFDTEYKQRFLMHLMVHHHFINCSNAFECTNNKCLFIITSYLNHSCSPNLININYDNRMVCMTTRQIQKGQQLFINYAGDLVEQTFDKWQTVLWERFKFLCECERCASNWPINSLKLRKDPVYLFIAKQFENMYSNMKFESKNKENLQSKCIELLKNYSNENWSLELQFISDSLFTLLKYRSE